MVMLSQKLGIKSSQELGQVSNQESSEFKIQIKWSQIMSSWVSNILGHVQKCQVSSQEA